MSSSWGSGNPLEGDSAVEWTRLIEAAGPASLLFIVQSRMSTSLQERLDPEDVLQECLMLAWRDRASCEWRGLRAFRAWLLTIIDHRIADLAEYYAADKRLAPAGPPMPAFGPDGLDLPARSRSTPSRVAMLREQSAAIRAALEALDPEVREIVRLRLIEQQPSMDIARYLGLSESAVRRRLRIGAAAYQRLLAREMASRSAAFTTRDRTDAARTALQEL